MNPLVAFLAFVIQPISNYDAGNWRSFIFPKLFAISQLTLMCSTLPLWIPQVDFPQVPLLQSFISFPVFWEWILCGLFWASLLVIVCSPLNHWRERWSLLLSLGLLGMLIGIDQHRLQPWTYHYFLAGVVLWGITQSEKLLYLRLITLSIYLYSGISKLDLTFCQELGKQFVDTLLGYFSLSLESFPEWLQLPLILSLPISEIVLVILLFIPRLRFLSLTLMIVMHLSIMLIVGPWGLNHKPSVYIWNFSFLLQNLLLFGPVKLRSEEPEHSVEESSSEQTNPTTWTIRYPHYFATSVIVLAITLPLLETFNWYDTWPSWGLYASRNQRTDVLIHKSDIGNLPLKWHRYLRRTPEPEHYLIAIQRWSLDETYAPIYPQNRFQLGVALGIAERYPLEHPLQIIQYEKANFLSGERTSHELIGIEAMKKQAAHYWLNALPRANLDRL